MAEYGKIMGFGTSAVEDGRLYLTPVGKKRIARIALAYDQLDRGDRMSESILLSGAFSKELINDPPIGREALLFADHLMNEYGVPARAIRIEDEATSTIENLEKSWQKHKDWFDPINPESKLGLVSDPYHLDRIMDHAPSMLGVDKGNIVLLPTNNFYNKLGEQAARAIMYENVMAFNAGE